MSVTKVTDAMRNVTEVDAAKITTGTIPDARIQASAVTAHVDLSAVRQDIAMLALYNAVSDNRAAYNLPFSFIDQFEDDTGLTTQTNVDRDASGEYVASVYSSFGTPAWDTSDRSSSITVTTTVSTSGTASTFVDGTTGSGAYLPSVATVSGKYLRFDFGSGNTVLVDGNKFYQSHGSTDGDHGDWKWQGSDNASDWTDITSSFNFAGGAGETIFTTLSANTTGYRYYQLLGISGSTGSSYWREMIFKSAALTTTANATGTLVSNVQTAPAATTEVSGVILYTDDEGTNTLGSSDDLAIYFTADNGSNWAEAASYGTPQTFSGTTKQVKLGKTTVTSGTQVAMKAVWANQAATVAGGYATGDQTSNVTFTTNANIYNYSGSLADGLANIVDGVTNSNSSSNAFVFGTGTQTSSGKYLRFEFTSAQTVTEVRWHQAASSNTHGTFIWQGSNTAGGASGYSNIGSTFTLGGTDGIQTITTLSGNSTAYIYYQMLGSAGSINDYPYIREIEFKRIAAVTGKVAQLNGWAVNY